MITVGKRNWQLVHAGAHLWRHEETEMAIKVPFNVDQYYRMAQSGILAEDDRVELIEGEIIKMSPIGVRHASCVNRLNTLFAEMLGRKAIVSVQNPLLLSTYSEPQPDLCLLRPKADFYADEHPSPADVFLVVEVADTSIGYDRDEKIPLYARAGNAEVWLIDLTQDTVTLYAEPIRGQYRQTREANRGGAVASNIFSELILEVDTILGASQS
jgi:Uma2 family endonuclease